MLRCGFFVAWKRTRSKHTIQRETDTTSKEIILRLGFLKSSRTLYLFIRQVKQYFMACNLHTCNCLLVLMIGWLLVEQLIKALVNQNVFF